MTTLEIKRLDSVSNKSPTSDRFNTSGGNNNRNSFYKANSPSDEVPISIIKSPSYNNQLSLSQQQQQKKSGEESNPSSLNSSRNATGNMQNHTSLDVTSTSTSDPANLDIDTDTLKFNRYGFAQPNRVNEQILLNESNANEAKQDTASTLTRPNDPATNKNDDTASSSGASSSNKPTNGGPVVVTNLKDYLQNTDVEEFAENLPIKVIQQRELKWVDMLNNFDEWMNKRFKKIKSRCRKGIPQSMRSKAWMHLTGAIFMKNSQPNYYQECLRNPKNIEIGRYVEDIKKDLHRQFPSHEIFMKKEGRQMLFNVLMAYAVHNKEVGYCQAQGPIAALLLMHMPEEDAFWMLIRISDYYLTEYYKPGLEKVQIDGRALFHLFKRENAPAYKLMSSQGIDPILYMTEWFMCIYARTLPWCTVLRVWDMFFCEGVKVLYRVGLHLMLSAFSDKQKFQRCQQQGMYETLNLLKNLPIEALKEADLVHESCLIKVGELDLKKAFDKAKQEFIKQANEIAMNRKQAPPKSSYVNTAKNAKT